MSHTDEDFARLKVIGDRQYPSAGAGFEATVIETARQYAVSLGVCEDCLAKFPDPVADPSIGGASAKANGKRLGVGNRTMPPDVLAAIVGMREDERLSMSAIANQLNAQQTPTARGGKRWYPSTVRSALGTHELDRAATQPCERGHDG